MEDSPPAAEIPGDPFFLPYDPLFTPPLLAPLISIRLSDIISSIFFEQRTFCLIFSNSWSVSLENRMEDGEEEEEVVEDDDDDVRVGGGVELSKRISGDEDNWAH